MPNINLNYKMVTDIKNNFFTNNRFIAAESLPAEGDFVKGDLIVNIGENANDEAMWLCVESGNPGVWEVVGAGAGGNTSGGGSSKIVTLKSRVTINNALSEVNIGVSGFNKATDTLIVFNNARFMVEGVDYEINADSTKIVTMNGNIWNEELANDYVFDFVIFKMMNVNENGDVIVSSANEIVKLKNNVVVNEAVNEVEIGIDGFNEGDDLTVYRNSVYMIEGIDYEVQGNKIVSLKGAWNAEGGSDYKFTFEVLKTVAKINPDAVVGMEHLTEDVKEAIEAAGNIDLSGKQDKTDEGLVTTDKTIVGAINELFQDVDSGKQLIADAIDDSNINKNSTFDAMSEAIEGIHADREEDRQKLVDILVGSNMDLTGNESMDTLLDLIDMSNLDLSKITQIACGANHTFILKNDGSVWSCGFNTNGQLGLGNTNNQTTFTQVTTNINNDVKLIACGANHTFILKNDGSVWSCGLNDKGQLGLGNTTEKTTFTQVTTNINNDVKQIACANSGHHTFILKNDGTVWSCGNNNGGQLGLGNTTNKTTFTQVTTNISNDVKQISCGYRDTFILKNDGSVWSCGYNYYGELGLGLGNNTNKTTFTQVTTNINNDVKQIACGDNHTFVLKNDGSVWSCGYNGYYQLGLGSNTNKTTFTQVTTNISNDVKQISCGDRFTFILKNDGSVWSCGYNEYGQLGLGNMTISNYTAFTQVTTNINNDVEQIACGYLHTFILKNDGSVWSCGFNTNGQLGLGNVSNQPSFVSVNQSEALQTQVTALQLENTANRGNLATVLTDEGVELTGSETLGELITKVDEEFDRKNNEIENSGGGLDIISATELPNVVTNNQIVMLTDTTPSSIDVVSFDLCNPAEGELNVCTTQLDSGNIFTFKSNGINVSLPLTNSYQMVNGLKTPIAGYYGVNDTWVQFSNGYYPMFENGAYLYEDLFGNMKVSSGGSLAITNNNIVATGTMGGFSVDMINTKAIDLSKFERVEMTVSISGSGYFYFAVCPSTNFATANAYKYVAINSGTYSLDLSSLTGTGYIGIDSTNNTQGKMSITISKIVFY